MSVRCFHRQFSLSSQPLCHVPLPSSPMEVHFWYIIPDEVKSGSLLNQYLEEVLLPCERKSVLSLRDDKIRKQALLARALVRTTIARYHINAQVGPKSFKFKRNLHGKPEVEWPHGDWTPPPLHFNLSHTSSLVACGVAMNSQIGIDVEEKNRTMKHDVVSFAKRFFCPREVEHLAAILNPDKQRQEFIKLWTLKEAYVKALGRGFSGAPFKTFTIINRDPPTRGEFPILRDADLESAEVVVEPVDGAKNLTSNWQFAQMELVGSHYAAICLEKENGLSVGTPMSLKVWKTIPLLEDKYMSGTDAIVPLCAMAMSGIEQAKMC